MSEYQAPQYAAPTQGKPGKLQAIAIMTLIDGILSILMAVMWAIIWLVNIGVLGSATAGFGCLVYPVCLLGCIYGIVVGILGIICGARLMSEPPKVQEPPKYMAVMQIINIVNLDILSVVTGILALVFYGDPEVEAYFAELAQQQPAATYY